jgi:hypothetical protein
LHAFTSIAAVYLPGRTREEQPILPKKVILIKYTFLVTGRQELHPHGVRNRLEKVLKGYLRQRLLHVPINYSYLVG